MSEGQPGSSKRYDPLEPFVGMRNAYLDAMAKTMVDVVNTEAYASANGALLETSLDMAIPFKEALEKSMLQVLQQLSLPSRQDILSLSERFTNMEIRLDDMDACLERLEKTLQKSLPPMLQQLVLIGEGLKNLSTRVQAVEVALDHLEPDEHTKSASAKLISPAQLNGKAHKPAKAATKAPHASRAKRTSAKGAQ